MSSISVEHIVKSYGDIVAVDDVSFSNESGKILALVGPDGAGKTSLLRLMCGLLDFERGEVSFGSINLRYDFEEIKKLLGYMPQNFSLYPDLTVEENLKFYAGLFEISKKEFSRKKEFLYEFSNLGPFRKRRASNLSGGMKQKLALSCALIHDPKILILDEPTTGVDPLSRRQFWDILKKLRDEGASILVSTPYMDEVVMSDRAVFIHHGKKLTEGTPEELTAMYSGFVYTLQVKPTVDTMEALNSIEGIVARRFGASIHIYSDNLSKTEDISETLADRNIEFSSLAQIEPELEDVFIQMMGN
ncbi:MAG: ABC transporter ATP-binding protein [candidate division Zixibacteria bacterium]|nr:ABC transporter ATP-binding protein [candidate division Zixibacteria bacterium]